MEEHSTAYNSPVLIDESMEVETLSIVGIYLGPANLGGLLIRTSAEVGKAAFVGVRRLRTTPQELLVDLPPMMRDHRALA